MTKKLLYSTLSGPGDADTATATNGWTFWIAEMPTGAPTPVELRDVPQGPGRES